MRNLATVGFGLMIAGAVCVIGSLLGCAHPSPKPSRITQGLIYTKEEIAAVYWQGRADGGEQCVKTLFPRLQEKDGTEAPK